MRLRAARGANGRRSQCDHDVGASAQPVENIPQQDSACCYRNSQLDRTTIGQRLSAGWTVRIMVDRPGCGCGLRIWGAWLAAVIDFAFLLTIAAVAFTEIVAGKKCLAFGCAGRLRKEYGTNLMNAVSSIPS